jgi:hypothetical protein
MITRRFARISRKLVLRLSQYRIAGTAAQQDDRRGDAVAPAERGPDENGDSEYDDDQGPQHGSTLTVS